jgi:hypothetical protein
MNKRVLWGAGVILGGIGIGLFVSATTEPPLMTGYQLVGASPDTEVAFEGKLQNKQQAGDGRFMLSFTTDDQVTVAVHVGDDVDAGAALRDGGRYRIRAKLVTSGNEPFVTAERRDAMKYIPNPPVAEREVVAQVRDGFAVIDGHAISAPGVPDGMQHGYLIRGDNRTVIFSTHR